MSGCSSSGGSKGAAKGGGVAIAKSEALAADVMSKILDPSTTVDELNEIKLQLQAAAKDSGIKPPVGNVFDEKYQADLAKYEKDNPLYSSARKAINEIKAGRKAIIDKAIQDKVDKANAKKEAAKKAKEEAAKQKYEQEKKQRDEEAWLRRQAAAETQRLTEKEEERKYQENRSKAYEKTIQRNKQLIQEGIRGLAVGGSYTDMFGNKYVRTQDNRVWKNNKPLLGIGETYRDKNGNIWENADGKTVKLGFKL